MCGHGEIQLTSSKKTNLEQREILPRFRSQESERASDSWLVLTRENDQITVRSLLKRSSVASVFFWLLQPSCWHWTQDSGVRQGIVTTSLDYLPLKTNNQQDDAQEGQAPYLQYADLTTILRIQLWSTAERAGYKWAITMWSTLWRLKRKVQENDGKQLSQGVCIK